MSAHPSSVRHRGRRPLVSVNETGEGEPLVLLHGRGTTQQIWSLVTPPHRIRRHELSQRDRLWCRGMIEDYLTYSRGWGFRPADVNTEVQVWHGGRDPLVPVEHALQLAVSLPACRIHVDPDEGHHFFRRRLEEIMTVLLDPDRGPHSLSVAGARALLAARAAA